MKIFSKPRRSRRNVEKHVSDSSKEHNSNQNCPEDTLKARAKLRVSKFNSSSRWKYLARELRSVIIPSTPKRPNHLEQRDVSNLKHQQDYLVNFRKNYSFKTLSLSETKNNENFSQILLSSLEENKETSVNEVMDLKVQFRQENISGTGVYKVDQYEDLKQRCDIIKEVFSDRENTTLKQTDNSLKIQNLPTVNEQVDITKRSGDALTGVSKQLKVDEESSENSFSIEECNRSCDLTNAELFDAATAIKDLILNHPNNSFSILFRKIFNSVIISKKELGEQNLKQMLEALTKELASSTTTLKTVEKLAPLASSKAVKKKAQILKKFVCSDKPAKKCIFAEVSTGKTISGYREAKDVLAAVFELEPSEFAGVSRSADQKSYSFLVDEEALFRYAKTRPNCQAGLIRPWTEVQLRNRISLATTICNKIVEHNFKSKNLKREAHRSLKTLISGNWPEVDCFTMEQVTIDRLFPARKL